MTRTRRPARLVPALLALALLPLAGCTDTDTEPPPPDPAPSAAAATRAPVAHPAPTEQPAPDALEEAVNEPREDSVYPDVGDPGVDALHYDLSLDWDPETRVLDGLERVLLRATADDDTLQLDLSPALTVRSVSVDGEKVDFRHAGKDLYLRQDVVADERYEVVVSYSGTPRPAAAPTTRGDFSTTGWTTTADGWTWTMQEPYGAYTWYAVNDHPSDKALYDVTVSVPSPWTGISNGELVSREEREGRTVTRWHLAEPAASYLVTLATGDYTSAEATSASGVPVTWWVPRDQPRLGSGATTMARELAWLEERLGPYPYDTAGAVLVESLSGMETQTMITLGISDYTLSAAVIVHELAHHWYGNQVTPEDWRDVWMNEGMAMYLQILWQVEQDGGDLETVLEEYAVREAEERATAGPPGDYDPATFGESNIYYGPMLMWHELRRRLAARSGSDADFWALVRAWPASRDNGTADREEYLAWVEAETGLELSAFFERWLMGATTPARS
ncbi:M1 family metallopeptidase [Nocardioides marmotae]|uniref:M1 family metallopeptidase n=1 Tax=Nocardioides marmotae TaxID=2663857 RepID=UPI0012B52748|nr:M1 family metallopeptidase [Nocardioides marmotae]MBC9732579.1 M1 family metallopeptidase [Nocardioides marmotae]MTB83698.1 M1 family peptidase [Nocardioides marmotae]